MVELNKTAEIMLSPNYKERFIAEFHQTKTRYEKLKAFCNKIEASIVTNGKVPEPLHDCPYELLREQQRAMGEYLHTLEVRAVIEGIELSEAVLYAVADESGCCCDSTDEDTPKENGCTPIGFCKE